jgi:lipopolysaccharide export system protein LptA
MPRHVDSSILAALSIALAFAWVPDARARSSDRNQPMDISAGHSEGSLDERTPTVLSGGVTIDQGTLNVQSTRAVITTRNGEITRVVLTGGPARLKQQLDDGTPMSAAANKIDYDVNSEVVVFTGKVNLQQPRGTVTSERVVYNMRTGQMNSGGEGSGGVKMRILPKSSKPAADEPADRPRSGG